MKSLGGAFLTLLLVSAFATNSVAHDDMDEFTFVPSNDCSHYQKATDAQIAEVQKGNEKYNEFLKSCTDAGVQYNWCQQLARPNPESASVFTCTYGNLPHQLVSPDESTWEYAFKAALMVQKLAKQQIHTKEIYNWWRPEPYNVNVGGAGGRHPNATSVDVRMLNMTDTKKALKKLCSWRQQGEMNALGYYGKTGIHFGVGDEWANTWGHPCK